MKEKEIKLTITVNEDGAVKIHYQDERMKFETKNFGNLWGAGLYVLDCLNHVHWRARQIKAGRKAAATLAARRAA